MHPGLSFQHLTGAALRSLPLALVLAFAASANAEVYLTEQQALALAFPDGAKVEKRTVILRADQAAALQGKLRAGAKPQRIYSYFESAKDGQPTAYAVIDDVIGKTEPITYLLVLGTDRKVRFVEIMAYRESHGGEVRQKAFREQYVGKTSGDPVRLGNDIRNIAGATLSCRNLSDSIKNNLVHLDAVLGQPAPSEPELPSPEKPVNALPPEERASETTEAGNYQPHRRSRYLMGAALEISVHAASLDEADRAINAAFAEVERLESLLSTWRPASELSRLNDAAGGESVPLGNDAQSLLALSLRMSEWTGGAFDITAGPLVSLWKDAGRTGRMPDAGEVKAAQRLVGPDKLELAEGRGRMTLPGSRVDVGGIGKGYALDRAAEVLAQSGIRSALLNFAGQILVTGTQPDGTAWTVEIRDPRDSEKVLLRLQLASGSVATTADDQRGLVIEGQPRSHIVNPATGQPANTMLSVSVIRQSAAEADALSTGLFVMDAPGIEQTAKKHGVAALALARDGALLRTGGFPPIMGR